ncbi:hypothetical protein HK414_20630 [Ramlibacter terrae]|uniref:Uncharacterized protein n=1 Tax=Ramlibacter terrae TaxID=2732511 RepID=A0ABX6P7F9_9BURK|nr:hypothetical protein HK414_20630 [Ramlibacter terrae]
MNAIDLLAHLLGFLAPAFAVAVLVAGAARVLLPKGGSGPGWWASVALDFPVGAAVLAAGLWYFGRDGKMATYAAMVAAIGIFHWVLARGWRG